MLSLEADLYNEQSNLQKTLSNEFFIMFKDKLSWKDLSRDTVMELGCGTGNSSTELILTHFPNVKSIIATDGSEDMIRLAKSRNPHPKVEYHVVDAQDESACRTWFGMADKVISTFCFQWIKDQTKAFRNVYDLLKPGGEACLLFPLNGSIFSAFESVKEIPKWKEMLKDAACWTPESLSKNLNATHYNSIFSDIGFEVILCEADDTSFVFSSEENLKKFLCSISPFMKYIPDNLKDEFMEDLFESNWKHSCNLTDNKKDFVFIKLKALIRKPFSR